MALKRNALGRGLGSLIAMDDVPATGSSAINEIDLELIFPNPTQPRSTFDEEALEELAMSIRELGIIQPLSLRKNGDETYQIIAGERRYRAAKIAGLKTVPAYIRTANDSELTEMALIENIQREDLNSIEIALTFKKLIDQYGLTQERLSERIGKKRATIANFLRLLRLPAEVQLGLRDRLIDMGHARALLILEKPELQLKLYKDILNKELTVRKVEEIATFWQTSDRIKNPPKKADRMKDDEYEILRKHLAASFSTPVKLICDSFGRGRITFQFRNNQELAKLIALFDNVKQQS